MGDNVRNYYVDVGKAMGDLDQFDKEKLSAIATSMSALADSMAKINSAPTERTLGEIRGWAQAFANVAVAVAVSAGAIWVVVWATTEVSKMLG